MPKYAPLTREEVVSVIEGKSIASRVPLQIHMWVHPETFGDREPAVRQILADYPQDTQMVHLQMPTVFRGEKAGSDFSWVPWESPYTGQEIALDEKIALEDWGKLDDVLEHFPSPDDPGLFNGVPARDARYRLGHWWYTFYERHWSLRGMTNALTDYYIYPDEVHRLFRALTDFYKALMVRAKKEQLCDGIFTSDDLGTQTGPFFSPEIFREFFKPYYRELFETAHELGMHYWLHTCGNVEPFIPDWIEIGLDVLHPIQKHTMSEREIAEKFGNQLTIFSGIDVQQVIPWGTPDEVRQEVAFLLDTYWRPGEGRCMLTAGNGINEDCTVASLEAFFDAAVTHGAKVAQ